MSSTTELPTPQVDDLSDPQEIHDRGYLVLCWDDPVNLMPYVTHVFRQTFGWDRERAEKHMREVHEIGKSVLVRDNFEKAEFYVHELQKYSLTATLEPAE